ncbi:hypothetical protein ACJX0J_039643, partial [Zea mays]
RQIISEVRYGALYLLAASSITTGIQHFFQQEKHNFLYFLSAGGNECSTSPNALTERSEYRGKGRVAAV